MIDGARVMVVDDEPLSREVLVRLLTSRGFKAESVGDGTTCLERVTNDPPDLVLLDVNMPVMSGLDVLRCIRERFAHDQLPVILVTALVDSEDVVAGLEAGANDYVVKPVNLPVLLARISVCIRIKRGVERLIDAERYRVKLDALQEACDQLTEPMSRVIEDLQRLVDELPPGEANVPGRLREILDWANQAGDLIDRFRRIAAYQRVPYTEGIASFVAASLAAGGTPRESTAASPPHDTATDQR